MRNLPRSLQPQNQESTHKPRKDNGPRGEQHLLNFVVEQEPQDCCRGEGHDQQDQQVATPCGLAEHTQNHVSEPLPEQSRHCQNRTELNGDGIGIRSILIGLGCAKP